MPNVRDYTHRAANSRAEDCIGCGRHQEHPVADASGEGPYCKTCAEHSNGGLGDPALTLPAAQADGPPRIWGIALENRHAGSQAKPVWSGIVSGFSVTMMPAVSQRGLYWWGIETRSQHAIIESGYVDGAEPEAALAIETELTRIETEIRTAREGKK